MAVPFESAGNSSLLTEGTTSADALQLDRDSNALLSLVNTLPGAVYQYRLVPQRSLHFVSPQIEALTGFPVTDFVGLPDRTLSSVIHPDDVAGVESAIVAAISNQQAWTLEYRLCHRSGQTCWVLDKGSVTCDERGQPTALHGFIQDIAARKKTELELLAGKEAAERTSRLKTEFLSSMSHELRTPMNAILGFGQLLERDKDMSGRQKEAVGEILKAGRHLLTLINEVLDMARVESGNVTLTLEPVYFLPLLQECYALSGPLAEKYNVVLQDSSTTCAADAWVVCADGMRLKQVLLNLLSNALKYNQQGGSVSTHLSRAGEGRIKLQVVDTGRGIPPDRIADLFQPFQRLDAANSQIEGTGIGLVITKRLVELMGGSVGVESQPGQGSTFWIDLPAAAVPTSEPLAPIPVPVPPDTGAPKGVPARDPTKQTVLYIEDNPANMKLVTQLMNRRPNIQLITSLTPELGIELAKAHQPDLILLDLHMPGMTGYQVLEVFKADEALKHVPAIAITANAMPRDIERGKAAGFCEYLTKPLDIRRFFEVVDSLLSHIVTQRQS